MIGTRRQLASEGAQAYDPDDATAVAHVAQPRPRRCMDCSNAGPALRGQPDVQWEMWCGASGGDRLGCSHRIEDGKARTSGDEGEAPGKNNLKVNLPLTLRLMVGAMGKLKVITVQLNIVLIPTVILLLTLIFKFLLKRSRFGTQKRELLSMENHRHHHLWVESY